MNLTDGYAGVVLFGSQNRFICVSVSAIADENGQNNPDADRNGQEESQFQFSLSCVRQTLLTLLFAFFLAFVLSAANG